ncbi:hypothetical protein [Erythrobacter sp. WG]|uniref:hypothetical protein n=1 Tax=Erythrobacter sp. WG TaxID=2985510 RepID=UPI00226EE116|nr:hypothetical protein [Erythrobacter sp. WG]MCX9146619.1 hypothetical protein [Erythrobacter sp. WG]
MSETADLEGGLVAYLKTIPAVAVLTASRIFAGELPAAETASMPRKAIVIRGSGGISLTGESRLEHDTQRVDLFAFGETPREAARVMRAAALALRRLERSVHAGCLLHWVNAASGSLSGREPETEWPRQFQSFQVMHGLLTIEE